MPRQQLHTPSIGHPIVPIHCMHVILLHLAVSASSAPGFAHRAKLMSERRRSRNIVSKFSSQHTSNSVLANFGHNHDTTNPLSNSKEQMDLFKLRDNGHIHHQKYTRLFLTSQTICVTLPMPSAC